jgi:hypothetical protein
MGARAHSNRLGPRHRVGSVCLIRTEKDRIGSNYPDRSSRKTDRIAIGISFSIAWHCDWFFFWPRSCFTWLTRHAPRRAPDPIFSLTSKGARATRTYYNLWQNNFILLFLRASSNLSNCLIFKFHFKHIVNVYVPRTCNIGHISTIHENGGMRSIACYIVYLLIYSGFKRKYSHQVNHRLI